MVNFEAGGGRNANMPPRVNKEMMLSTGHRGSVLLLVCFLLSNCSIQAQQKEKAEAYDGALQQAQSAMAVCDTKYPKGDKRYVEKTKCQNDATNIIRPFMPYPDLVDRDTATRMSLAEKLQTGKLTEAQADSQLTQARAQINVEDQRRQTIDRSRSVQEDAAAVASRMAAPVGCTSFGVITKCY